MSNSGWQTIYTHLKTSGFEVYSPAQHEGPCRSKYLVIKDNGTIRFGDYSSTQTVYEILCYVPRDEYSALEAFLEATEKTMEALMGKLMLRSTFTRGPSFYDETIEGHMCNLQYELYRKMTPM